MSPFYFQIFLPSYPQLFCWHSSQKLAPGDLVEVPMRNKNLIGLVVSQLEEPPKFKTRAVVQIIQPAFVGPQVFEVAQAIARRTGDRWGLVLKKFFPPNFFAKCQKLKKQITWRLLDPALKVRGARQQELLEWLKKTPEGLDERLLVKKFPATVRRALAEYPEIEIEANKLLSAIPPVPDGLTLLPRLSEEQQKAFDKIREKRDTPSLLFGVTGSGKTEVYQHLVFEALAANPQGQGLLLIPEIALTPQLVRRFQQVFGNKLAVWHSRLSAGEKHQELGRLLSGEAQLVIGTRSALLLPWRQLSIVILDEEHEWTYKGESSPRYRAHSVAEVFRELMGAQLVFGSATPRAETWYRAHKKEYQLVPLRERFNQAPLPEIIILDRRQDPNAGTQLISTRLEESIAETLHKKQQGILFLNRRGQAGLGLCKDCGKNLQCPHCEVSLKAHGPQLQKLICHWCGHSQSRPENCPSCNGNNWHWLVWGTQQLEEEFSRKFPTARWRRVDADTMSRKQAWEEVCAQTEAHELDFLIGTQMITKGLDFSRMTLVGIIAAEDGLLLPDFRAQERVLQRLWQVAGRAGRHKHPGQIWLQTFRPEDPLWKFLSEERVAEFLDKEIEHRQRFGWPLDGALVRIVFSDPNQHSGHTVSRNYHQQLQLELKQRLPKAEAWWAPCFFPKTHGQHHFQVLLKGVNWEQWNQLRKRCPLPARAKLDLDPDSVL